MIYLIWTAVLVVAIAFYLRNVYSTFAKKGVKNQKPLPLLGNVLSLVTKKYHMVEFMQDLYEAFPGERFVGTYIFFDPTLMIVDPELIKKITIKDFEHFMDRSAVIDDKVEPTFGRNLFSLKGQEWKDMRLTLSPAFTSSKIRLMVPFMVEVNEQMIRTLKKKISESKTNYVDIECKDLTTRYANDVIATCAFGVKVDSHSEENNLFYRMGRSLATFTFKTLMVFFGYRVIPFFMKSLKIKLFTAETRNFFRNLVLDNIKEREMHKIMRPDMIHLLMEAKNGNVLHEEKTQPIDSGFAATEEFEFTTKTVQRDWSDDDLIAQAILFFIAGFDTVSSTMSFLLYELAMNPDIQDRLVEEIRENDAKNGGKLDYNSIQNLKYLDMVVSEVLRLWSPMAVLTRECVKEYNLGKPNADAKQDYIMRKGEGFVIPVWPVQRNPAYFPNPTKFDPERFSDENKGNIKPFTYIPFGAGPRNCIGARFALCEVKVMVYQMIQQLEVSPCEKTTIPPKLDVNTFSIMLKNGHWLRIKARE